MQSLKVLCRKVFQLSQHTESVDRRTKRRTNRKTDRQTPDEQYSKLTKILSKETFRWSLKVLCRKVFQLSQHKESVDRQTDGQTGPRWSIFELNQNLTQTNILTKLESSLLKSIPAIAAQCSIRERNVKKKKEKKLPVTLNFDVMIPKTIGVLLIWYITHIQNLKVLCRKVFKLSQHKESVDRRWDYYRAPTIFNAGALKIWKTCSENVVCQLWLALKGLMDLT